MPSAPREFRYRAFLSYSHVDEKWGRWLHRALESYRVPRALTGEAEKGSAPPARLGRVFRDREELSASHDLGSEIRRALNDSETLIVVCSPNAARSRWVNEEVLTWKLMGRGERLYAVIVEGEPHATNLARECFPPALRHELDSSGNLSERIAEPMAADARDSGDGRQNALLKLIAGILGVTYDSLRRRDEEARARSFRHKMALATMLALIFAGLAAAAGWFAWQSNRERARAQANLDTATAAATSMVLDIGNELKNVEGMQRSTLLTIQERAQALLDQLAEGQELTVAGRRARAVSLVLTSKVLSQSGDVAAAISAANDALERIRQLTDAHPDDLGLLRDLARALETLGDHLGSSGDDESALHHYRAALAIYDRLLSASPSDGDLARTVSGLWSIMGAVLREDRKAAREAFQQAIAVLDRLFPEDSNALRTDDMRARAEEGLSNLAWKEGDVKTAETHARTVAEIRRRLADANPGDSWHLGLLASATSRLSGILRDRDAIGEALDNLNESTRINRRLYLLDPGNLQTGAMLVANIIDAADTKRAAGDRDGALVAYTEATVLAEELVAKSQDDTKTKLLLATLLMKRGTLEQRSGLAEASRRSLSRASALAATVTPPDPMAPIAAKIVSALDQTTSQ
ncbi:MAG: toll/interleukin-1 receptor domain-containing protein [Gammaproteobacteria bacterium]|nr:toll/interleukin-1 receptor domain-containing protein [Gammaproteobacteria bacterium]